jgi:hypothetical protein
MRWLTLVLLFSSPISFGQNWESVGGGCNAIATDIWIDDSTQELFAVGSFNILGGITADHMGGWNGVYWDSLITPMSSFNFNPVSSIVRLDGDIVVSSTFEGLDNNPANGRIIRKSGGLWTDFGSPDSGGWLRLQNDELYYVGGFNIIGGDSVSKVAHWTGTDWEQTGIASVWGEESNDYVVTIEEYNGELILAGRFHLSNGFKNIVSWDGVSLSEIGGGITGGSAKVNDLIVYDDILYVGGVFYSGVNGGTNEANHIMAWDGEEWFNPFPNIEFQHSVTGFDIDNGSLYIAGIHRIGEEIVNRPVLMFDGVNACSFGGTSTQNYATGKIEVSNGEVYIIAGGLPEFFGDPTNRLAHWIGSNVDTCTYNPISLDIIEIDNKVSFKIYPNPSNESVNINWFGSGINNYSIQLYSVEGRLIKNQRGIEINGENEINLNLEDIPSGTYLVDLNGIIKKIIINK